MEAAYIRRLFENWEQVLITCCRGNSADILVTWSCSLRGSAIPEADPSSVLPKGPTHPKYKGGTGLCQRHLNLRALTHLPVNWSLETFVFQILTLTQTLNLSLSTAREYLKYMRTYSAICKSFSVQSC